MQSTQINYCTDALFSFLPNLSVLTQYSQTAKNDNATMLFSSISNGW